MADVLRFGIAGLGVASTQILAAFKDRPHLQITAAADVRPHALKVFEQEYEGEGFATVEEMAKSPNVDAIYVCTPNHLHCEHVISAANLGKHVIVEKPMGLNLDECERMNEAAERNHVKLLCGHTHSFDPPIKAMARIVRGGELGKLGMINSWFFNQFMYRPRMPHELDPTVGGNVVFNQGPHHVDIVRLIGGGLVRSVRAMTGIWDPARKVEGAWCAYLEFEDGTPCTLVYNGYGHFNTSELTWWLGEGGQPSDPNSNFTTRKRLAEVEDEAGLKEKSRYAGGGGEGYGRGGERHQPFFGFTVVSCEHGDIRQSPDGLYIYGDEELIEVPVEKSAAGREAELLELYEAVVDKRPVFHDGRWGEATLEVVLGIMQSAKERKEIFMSHQVPAPVE